MQIRVHGFHEAQALLQGLPAKVRTNVIRHAARKAADVFVPLARGAAPIRSPKTTGATVLDRGTKPRAPGYLRRQIKRRARKKNLQPFSVGFIVGYGRAYYAPFLITGAGGRRQGSAARDVFGPAYTAGRDQALATFKREFQKRLALEVRKSNG